MNIPNFLTLLRILFTPIFFTLLVSYTPEKEYLRWLAFGVFFSASILDALDGFLARKLNCRTELGAFLDPLADKMLLASGFMGLLFTDALIFRPALWIIITIIFRDIVIIVGIMCIYLVTGKIKIVPNMIGKITTTFQLLLMGSILLNCPLTPYISYIVVLLCIVSGFIYVKIGMKMGNVL